MGVVIVGIVLGALSVLAVVINMSGVMRDDFSSKRSAVHASSLFSMLISVILIIVGFAKEIF